MTTFTTTPRQFAELVTPVIPFAGTDAMLPVINSVHIEAVPGSVFAHATDRFTVGIKRQDYTGKPFTVTLSLAVIRTILSTFKAASTDGEAELTITLAPESVTVSAAGGLVEAMAAEATYPRQVGEYPAIRGVVVMALSAEPEPDAQRFDVGINPVYMARFAKVVGRAQHLVWRLPVSKKRPLVCTDQSGDFIGAIMANQTVSDRDWSGWLDVLQAPKPAARKKAS